ncbi:XRE family transcriptional regulator [Brucella sp. 6810]|nr:XRE family transcriptional regulator [Brucella sp. 6810]
MDIKDQIRLWIKAELAARGHGAKGQLADYLGVRPDIVTRMLNTDPDKETRVIRAEELVKISEFFGSPPPGIAGIFPPIDADFARLYNSVDETTRGKLKDFLQFLSSQK